MPGYHDLQSRHHNLMNLNTENLSLLFVNSKPPDILGYLKHQKQKVSYLGMSHS